MRFKNALMFSVAAVAIVAALWPKKPKKDDADKVLKEKIEEVNHKVRFNTDNLYG